VVIKVLAGLFAILAVLHATGQEPEKTDLFTANTDGFELFRIPGIVVTAKGTALAYCEARHDSRSDWGEIEVHLRRSTDGGRTWSKARKIAHMGERAEGDPRKKAGGEHEQTVNNPVAIVDRNGSVHFLYELNYARCFSMRSDDDGLTWTKPVEITAAFEGFRKTCDWKVIATGPGHGIQLKSGRLESMPAMVDLVTSLSPHFIRPFSFGAFALVDAGRPDLSMKLLERGFRENPTQWGFPAYLGYFAYQYGTGTKAENSRAAAAWDRKAAAVPSSPPYLVRLAAVLSGKGGDVEKAVLLWGQVYAGGDKYSRQKAIAGLDSILPTDKAARMKAVAPLYQTMPKAEFDQLIAELFKGYAP